MKQIPVKVFARLNHENGLPRYETAGAAGMDVRANEEVVVPAKGTKLVPTGLFVAVPDGYEIQVRPRSGLSLKTVLRVANAPGTVDSDYRGEICVLVWNTGDEDFTIPFAERIGQLVLSEVPQIVWEPVGSMDDLGSTQRGVGGFGSTG